MQQKSHALIMKFTFYVCAATYTVQQPREQPEQPGQPGQPEGVAVGEGDPRSTVLAGFRGEEANGVVGECSLQELHRGASNGGASHGGALSGTAGEERRQGGNVDSSRCVEAK